MEKSNQAAPNDARKGSVVPLETSIREELDSLSPLSSDCCIYKIPDRLRCVNERAYIPDVVSIGPLNHGNEALKAMEEHKLRYLQYFLHRTNVSLEDYIKKIRDREEKLRSCYAEPIKFSSDEFVRIILVDAAFVLELLLRDFKHLKQEGDRILNKPYMLLDVVPDLLKVENQLPFFILEDIFDLEIIDSPSSGNNTSGGLSIFNIIEAFLGQLGWDNDKWKIISSSSSKVEHFVHLIRTLCLPLESELQTEGRQLIETVKIPTLTELHQAGVKLKVRSGKNLVDIQFADGILEIPKIFLSTTHPRILENLVAFEQCHCIYDKYINDYVNIMGRFVSTPKDVELLVEYGILDTHYNASEASSMITQLASKPIRFLHVFYYGTLCEDLNKYYRSSWNKWKANLRQNYFNTPWASISVFAAVVLLLLALIQTVCSVISTSPSKHE
ncbi:hypothetical protein CerSpe_051020 [Prunus speciosa]